MISEIMTLMSVLAIVGAVWFYPSICIWRIANKVGISGRWMAWIPVLSLVLVCRIGGQSGWLAFLCLIPYIGVIIAMLIMIQLPKALGVKGAARFLIAVPVVNYFYLGYLAFREEKSAPPLLG
jgi:hypothetical protein